MGQITSTKPALTAADIEAACANALSASPPSPIASIQQGAAAIPAQVAASGASHYNGSSVTVTISAVNQGRSILSPRQYYAKHSQTGQEVMIYGTFVSDTEVKFATTATNVPGVKWVVRYEVVEFV